MSKHEQVQSDYWDQEAKRISEINDTLSDMERKEINDFFRFSDFEKQSEILEVGCGAGRFTLALLAEGHRVTATDLSEMSLKELNTMARQRGFGDRLTTLQCSHEKKMYGEKFDYVFIGNVIHHFEPRKRQRIMNNLVRELKPNGKIVIWEPSAYCPLYLPWYILLELSGKSKGIWQAEKGVLNSTAKKINKLLQKAGVADLLIERHSVIPLRLNKFIRIVPQLNKYLEKTPLIKYLAAYIWISGYKK